MNQKNHDIIEFFDKDQPYFEFSNFARFGFHLDGHYWPTVEHYYQAAKFNEENSKARIRQAATPGEAKQLGRCLAPLRPDWTDVKEAVMLSALHAKFKPVQMRQLLLETQQSELLEASPYDNYWGTGEDGKGQNRLGKLLMQVRDELRQKRPVKHIQQVKGYPGSHQQLADEIGDLYYDSLAELLRMIAGKIERDGDNDATRGRKKLANALHDCSAQLTIAARSIDSAWRICEPRCDRQ
jgi:hypothetical protein